MIDVPEDVLADLRRRLGATRWPDQIPGTAWEYGTDLGYLRDLCRYWQSEFDWRASERTLNTWPQAITTVDGQRIHFIHARSEDPAAIPLLVLHGWPGSVAEMVKIIEPLRAAGRPEGAAAPVSFHVVCPSLPGFGFSGPTTAAGWHPRRMATAFVELMERLGYQRFATLGGDWGATISNYLGLDHPGRLIGLYLTMVAAGPPPGSDLSELSEADRALVQASADFFVAEAGYQQIQGTKPQTLSYGLNDSPAGLAGWMVEKYRSWSDCDGVIDKAFTADEILTNVTLYWVTATVNSAARIYFEAMRAGQFQPIDRRIEVPTGCAIFPKETVRTPRSWAERAWEVRQWTEMPHGGHFPALEAPDLLVADVRRFYASLS